MRETFNCAFGYPIYSDPTSGYITTLSGGSWLATGDIALANVQDRRMSKIARSTDATLASTKMVVNLTAPLDIRSLYISLPNASRAAKVRWRGANVGTNPATDFGAPMYDTGWLDVYRSIYPPNVLPFGHPALFDGRPTQAQWDAGFRMDSLHVAAAEQIARYWLLEIDDTANVDGHVDIGRLIVAPAYQMQINIAPGAKMGLDDPSTAIATDSGTQVYNAKQNMRTLTFGINNMSTDEALSMVYDMFRSAGKTRQFLWVFDPTDTYHMMRRSFPAVFKELSGIEYALYDSLGALFSIREDR